MAVSDVSFVGATQVAGAVEPWVVTFTTGANLPPASSVLVRFPSSSWLADITAGSAFPSPGVAGLAFGGDFSAGTYCYVLGKTDDLLQLTLYDDAVPTNLLAAGQTGTITFGVAGTGDITNPGAGSYPAAGFEVYTNVEGGAVNPPDPIIITGAALAPDASTSQPSAVTADSMTLNGVVSSNGAETTVIFRYGTDPTLSSGTSTVTATQSPLADDAADAAVSAGLTSLTNQTFYYRVEATNSEGTTNGSIIAVSPLATRYWVGGTGNWSAAANWSTSSGGSGGAGKPTRTVNAVFDANSFDEAAQVVTVDGDIEFLSMDWTGATGTPEIDFGSSDYNVICCGSLTFIEGMTVSGTLDEVLGWLWDSNPPLATGTPTTNTIDTAGHTIPVLNENPTSTVGMRMTGGGSWTLQSDFLQHTGGEGAGAHGTHLFLTSGALDANGYDIDLRGISNTEVAGDDVFDIDFAGITLTIHDFVSLANARGTIDVTGLNFITDPDIDYCIVVFRSGTEIASWYAYPEYGVGPVGFWPGSDIVVLGPLTLVGGGLYATDDTIGTPGTVTVGALAVAGGAEGNLASLTGPLIASATLNTDWLDLTDCPLSGETPGYAGDNSEDNGGNTNWLFEPGPSNRTAVGMMMGAW